MQLAINNPSACLNSTQNHGDCAKVDVEVAAFGEPKTIRICHNQRLKQWKGYDSLSQEFSQTDHIHNASIAQTHQATPTTTVKPTTLITECNQATNSQPNKSTLIYPTQRPLHKLPSSTLASAVKFTFKQRAATVCLVAFIICLFSNKLFRVVKCAEECQTRQKCDECFTTSSECAWCTQDSFSPDGSSPRCDSRANLIKAGCVAEKVFRPDAEFSEISDFDISNATNPGVIQLRPQRIKVRLPPQVSHTINLQYSQVKHYPVDLYYLMDLSLSMRDDKQKLAELGNTLAERLKEISKNFSLGFGSFVDKVTMPYVSMVPEKLKAPCADCAAPYGFRNHMPLSTEPSEFTRLVNESQISGNLDAPEGGLDAVQQSIVCKDEVGWRDISRKMLVFTTDANCHFAGDGKLAGIVTPNDGKCHLDERGYYTESTEQDYPSISQIHQIAKEQHVNIIFAVTENLQPIYKKMTPLIEGSSVGMLKNDSSNIVQLIEERYNEITSEIELKSNATDNIQITYRSSCTNSDGKLKETNICKGIKLGNKISFEIDIELKSCPQDPREFNQTIKIYPVGLSEALLIDLEMICECDCQKPWNVVKQSPKCDEHGTEECGICICDPSRYGRNCECDARESDPNKDLMGCYKGNDTRVCSGRGSCRCGVCVCKQNSLIDPEAKVYGKHCECDNFSCFHHDNKICSGPDHGVCECGECICNKDWTGAACECQKSNHTCIDPATQKVCAGHGECICGHCQCKVIEDRHYSGEFCQICDDCPSMCEQYKDCVRCQTFGTGPLSESPELCLVCQNSTFSIQNVTSLGEIKQNEVHCGFIDDFDDCYYQFKYRHEPTITGENVYIDALVDKDCPNTIPFFLILLLLALLILLLGLLGLLLWKCLTIWKEKREKAKFENERLTTKWETGENPIFEQATATYKNLTYKK